jgi:hypothetical protein
VVNLGQFGGSLGASGYQKLPNGLIFQWGVSAYITGGGSAPVTFPITFPNGFLGGVASTVGQGATTVAYSGAIQGPSASGFTMLGESTAAAAYYWFVFGH